MPLRPLHPGAWWIWALGLAVLAARTTNPLTLLAIIAATSFVVLECRTSAPWALSFRAYLYVGGFVITLRMLFRIIFGGFVAPDATVLIPLPALHLPEWAAGMQLGGNITAEAMLGAGYDGLRLATMIVCVGAANSLANPKRLLKAVPGALYEVGTAVIVAISVFPQLATSAQRINQARKLRGAQVDMDSESKKPSRRTRVGMMRGLVVPVLTDALDNSLHLAAAMDTRGYGRRAAVAPHKRRATAALVLIGLGAITIGVYGVLDGTTPTWLGLPMLLTGVVIAVISLRLTGQAVQRTRYRPDKWNGPALIIAASGVVAAASAFIAQKVDPLTVTAPVGPPWWPEPAWVALAGIAIALVPVLFQRRAGGPTTGPVRGASRLPETAQVGEVA